MRDVYQLIDNQRKDKRMNIKMLCKAFNVTRSAYYNYTKGKTNNLEYKYNRPSWEIRREFIENRRRYGSRRIKKSLENQGIKMGRNKIRKIMKMEDLKAIQPRSFIPRTTDSKHGKKVCDNLLINKPLITAPNQVWVTDITYLPISNGKWAYLVAYSDLFTKQVVAWQVADHMRESLVREPLEKALIERNIKGGLIIHSDRGGQYLANNFKTIINTFELKQSMSRADDPYDNAWAESLWSRLKAEIQIPKAGYKDLLTLKNELFDYIEYYYNRKRLHSSIGYKTPYEFEQEYYKKSA